MQDVIIVGPNLRDQSKGDFHVHAVGCLDLRRDPNMRYENKSWRIDDAASKIEVIEEIYSDIMDENGDTADDYMHDVHFAPCVTLPVRECEGHPADEFSPMGETTYCNGSCRGRS